MIKAGMVKVTCDECGYFDYVDSMDYLPQGWYALLRADHTKIPRNLEHFCTEECVAKNVRAKAAT